MESYIPGIYVRFCCIVWVQACCYRSQKKNDTMHQLKVAISCNAPYRVVRAYCSCVAGCSGMCSHIVRLLKQLIHYTMMKLQSVPADLTCTRMQQSWHKPRPTEIKAAPVMNMLFSKAKQSEAKSDPVMCSLYKAHAKCVQEYNFEQQQCLKEGLLNDHPACAFTKLLSTNPPNSTWPLNSEMFQQAMLLSYQALEYDKPQVSRESPSDLLPALPLDVIKNAPCVFDIESESKMNNSIFDTRQYSIVPAPINHGLLNEVKARNSYPSK